MDSIFDGQKQLLQLMSGFVDSKLIKCATELQIADIIHSHGAPITLSGLAAAIDSPNPPDLGYLERIMRYLVSKKVFGAFHQTCDGNTLYELTHISKWLLSDSDLSLSPMIALQNHVALQASWDCLSQCVKHGGVPFEKANNGSHLWDFASQNPGFNRLFQQALDCTATISIKAAIFAYNDGFSGVKTLVDVGGGTGSVLIEILKSFPHIKGINFDLPHVIDIAKQFSGISHVGGDMFESIPSADAILMKSVLHDWGDEYCVKILKTCRKALSSATGKLILVETVVEPKEEHIFENMDLMFDMSMLIVTNGGKERSNAEWKILLADGGFSRYNIIRIPNSQSIIEAFPF